MLEASPFDLRDRENRILENFFFWCAFQNFNFVLENYFWAQNQEGIVRLQVKCHNFQVLPKFEIPFILGLMSLAFNASLPLNRKHLKQDTNYADPLPQTGIIWNRTHHPLTKRPSLWDDPRLNLVLHPESQERWVNRSKSLFKYHLWPEN